MARRKHSKRNKNLPFLAGAALILVAVIAVSLAFLLGGSEEEIPTDSPVTSTAPSQTTSEVFPTDPVTDVFSSTGSGVTSDPTTDTEGITDTVTSSKSSSTDKNQTTTDTGTKTDTGTNTGTTSDEPSNPLLTKVPKPTDGVKRIAFTFDDGPHYDVTVSIADMFAQYGGKCTYFIVGNRVAGRNAEAVSYAASKGHEIAIHGYTHDYYYDKCSDSRYEQEVTLTHQAIVNTIGVAPTLLRPPGGGMKNSRVKASPYAVILWNVDPKDWYYKKESKANVNQIVNHILKYAEDGDIVLMHDLYENTRDAVEILLPKLKEMGYEFVTVSELMGDAKAAGQRYSGGYN